MFPWNPAGTGACGLVGDIGGLDAVHRHVGSERRIGADGERTLEVQRAVTNGDPEDCHRYSGC